MNNILKQAVYYSCCILATHAQAVEWRGSTALEQRAFLESPIDPRQHDNYSSVIINPELYWDWDSGRQSVTFTPFYRWDQYDDERTHADLREFYWLIVGDRYEFSLGLRKIFWGTTESQHLVDVVNQTDLVENPDGEDKLGQPMLATLLLTDWGDIEFYLLPYFRERTFPGQEGRLRTIPRVDTNTPASYESSKRDKHVDLAVRLGKTIGSWDIGLSYFSGTNREPRLLPIINISGEAVLLPVYDLMQQLGLDIQGVTGAWLWKLEAIHRDTRDIDFTALTAGLEYTFYNIKQSRLDIGIVAEYLYDDRGDAASTPFEDDVMLGMRLTPNDVQSTEFLLGVILDRSGTARVYRLETSRRLSNHLSISIDASVFSHIPQSDPLYSFRQDDYVQLDLSYYF